MSQCGDMSSDMCYTADMCCEYQDCCDVSQCGDMSSEMCYTDEMCRQYMDCCDYSQCATTTVEPTTTEAMINYSICGVKVYENVECTGATNPESETVSFEECHQLAMNQQYMHYSYNSDKGKCFGVTEETQDACLTPVDDESEKWTFYEFWCSEGYTEQEDCAQNDYSGYAGTNADEGMKCANAANGDSFEATVAECNNFAMDEGYSWFSYRDDQGLCFIPNSQSQEINCWNINSETGLAWDVYIYCLRIRNRRRN